MVKHTQTIRWQKPTSCLSVYDRSEFGAYRDKKTKFTI